MSGLRSAPLLLPDVSNSVALTAAAHTLLLQDMSTFGKARLQPDKRTTISKIMCMPRCAQGPPSV